MHKIGRWILLALFVAFLAGLMPTIFEWCDRFFVFTEEGLGVTRHFTHTVDSVFLTLKDYAWHITIIYAAVIAFVIFMEGQNPDRTILWMLALIFLPVFGVVLYLVIGPDFRSLRKRRLFRPSKRYGFDDTSFRGHGGAVFHRAYASRVQRRGAADAQPRRDTHQRGQDFPSD